MGIADRVRSRVAGRLAPALAPGRLKDCYDLLDQKRDESSPATVFRRRRPASSSPAISAPAPVRRSARRS